MNYNIGSILKSRNSNTVKGVIIYKFPNALLILKNNNCESCSFAKLPYNQLNNDTYYIDDNNINHSQYSDIKHNILKFIQTRNLSDSENKVLRPIINFSFPNGIPNYNTTTTENPDTILHKKLMDRIVPKQRLLLFTKQHSPFHHCNEKKCIVLKNTESGMWLTPQEQYMPIFLPYNNPDLPSFYGISRLQPLDNEDITNPTLTQKLDTYLQNFNTDELDNNLRSHINIDDSRVQVLPNENFKIVIPSKYKNQRYDFKLGKCVNCDSSSSSSSSTSQLTQSPTIKSLLSSHTVTSDMFDNIIHNKLHTTTPSNNNTNTEADTTSLVNLNEISNNDITDNSISSNNTLSILKQIDDSAYSSPHMIHSSDLSDLINNEELDDNFDNNNNEYNNNEDNNDITKLSKNNIGSSVNYEDDLENEALDIESTYQLGGLRSRSESESSLNSENMEHSHISDTETSLNSDYSESEPELDLIEDEDFNLDDGEVFARVRQIPKPEGQKVFKESIQKGRIKKQLIEKLPKIKRNAYYEQKIDKIVDYISLLKNSITSKENTIIYKSITKTGTPIKPLVQQFINDNFTSSTSNKFIIPLVIANKKIYLIPKDKINKSEFEETQQTVIDFYDEITKIDKNESQTTFQKNKMINSNEEYLKKIDSINPYSARIDNNNIGYKSKIGYTFQTQVENTYTASDAIKLETEKAYDRIMQSSLDAEVFRLGTNQYKFLSYGSQEHILEKLKLLGPVVKGIKYDSKLLTREEIEELENQIDRNIEPTTTRTELIYSGDSYNIVGFVRPPITKIIITVIKNLLTHMNINIAKLNLDNLDEIIEDKIHDNKIKYIRLDKIDNHSVEFKTNSNLINIEFSNASFIHPDKYIIFSLPNLDLETGSTKQNNDIIDTDIFSHNLDKVIPTVEDIITYITYEPQLEFIKHLNNSNEIISKILLEFGYIYSESGIEYKNVITSNTNRLLALNYEQYMFINKEENKNIKHLTNFYSKVEKLYKLHLAKLNKSTSTHESTTNIHRNAKIITDDIIDITDKIYGGEPFKKRVQDLPQTRTDEFRMDYLAVQRDLGVLYSLLLKKNYLLTLLDSFNLEKHLSTLTVLQQKYDTLTNDTSNNFQQLPDNIKNKYNICGSRISRKDKIIKYPSIERLEADNGKIATTPTGDMISIGDYAVVELDSETKEGKAYKEKRLYKRHNLHNGDYWLQEPEEAFQKLLKTKTSSCQPAEQTEAEMIKRATMQIDNIDDLKQEVDKETISKEEIQQCIFDPDTIQCVPKELVHSTNELKELKMQIQDAENAVSCAKLIPVMLSDVNMELKQLEQVLNDYNTGKVLMSKYNTEKYRQLMKENEELDVLLSGASNNCKHIITFKYIESMQNISDSEYYRFMKEYLIDKYVNDNEINKVNLDIVNTEPSDNYLKCNTCDGKLICKHYLKAFMLMNDDDDNKLDMDLLANIYGYTSGETIYCKICGKFLITTDTKDIEGFEGGEDGKIIKTREVVEERDVIKEMKDNVAKMITDAIYNIEGKVEQEDFKKKIEIFDLLKGLCGLNQIAVNDDLEMLSFLKSYQHAGFSRKGIKAQVYVKFLKVGKKLTEQQLSLLTEQEYQKIMVLDVTARFLVMLQTSKQIYPVNNKLCNGAYMGYPMLTSNKDKDTDGLKLCICLLKQIAMLPKYTFLISAKSGTEGLYTNLLQRLDLLLDNDELTRTKCQLAVEECYRMITAMEEERVHESYYWATFRPSLGFATLDINSKNYNWAPKTDFQVSDVVNWNSKSIDAIIQLIQNNIDVRGDNMYLQMEKQMFNKDYTTKLVRDSQVANGGMLYYLYPRLNDYFSQDDNLNKNTITVNYYDGFFHKIPDLKKLFNQSDNLYTSLEYLNQVTKPSRINLQYDTHNELEKFKKQLDINLAPEQHDIMTYFLKYIDFGINKGDYHLFNDFGRCLVSNVIKNEKEQQKYTQTDLLTLFKDVCKKNIKLDAAAMSSKLQLQGFYDNNGNNGSGTNDINEKYIVCGLFTAFKELNNSLSELKELLTKNKFNMLLTKDKYKLLEKIIEINGVYIYKIESDIFVNLVDEVLYNQEFTYFITRITKQFTITKLILDKAIQFINDNSKIIMNDNNYSINLMKYAQTLIYFVLRMHKYDLHIFNEQIKQRLKLKVIDDNDKDNASNYNTIKNVYFTGLNNINQYLIEIILDTLSEYNIKNIDDLLINGGDYTMILNDIKDDITLFKSQYLTSIEYINDDVILDKFNNIYRSDFIIKSSAVINYIVSNLSNNTWDNIKSLKDISKSYYDSFIKYKDVKTQFKDIVSLTTYISELLGILNIYNNNVYNNNDTNVFLDSESRYNIIRFNYLFLICLILDGDNSIIISNNTALSKSVASSVTSSVSAKSSTQKGGDAPKLLGNELEFSNKLDNKLKKMALSTPDNDMGALPNATDLNKATEYIDVEMYPEIIVSDNYTNEPGEDLEDEGDDFIDMIEDALDNKKNKSVVMKQFIGDLFKYLIELQKLYSSMNNNTVAEEISKGRNAIIKENLRINRDLSAEGMEDTRKMVNNLRMLGRLDYTNIADNYDNIMQGADELRESDYEDDGNTVPEKEIKDKNDGELFAKDDIYGNDEAFYEEDVFVGDAEDMEGGDFDYGYLGVD